jgi:hypothetical protein
MIPLSLVLGPTFGSNPQKFSAAFGGQRTKSHLVEISIFVKILTWWKLRCFAETTTHIGEEILKTIALISYTFRIESICARVRLEWKLGTHQTEIVLFGSHWRGTVIRVPSNLACSVLRRWIWNQLFGFRQESKSVHSSTGSAAEAKHSGPRTETFHNVLVRSLNAQRPNRKQDTQSNKEERDRPPKAAEKNREFWSRQPVVRIFS